MTNKYFTLEDVMEQLLKNASNQKERFNLIFRFNNALVLERYLRNISEDSSYTIDENKIIDRFVFVNKNNVQIELDNNGKLIVYPECLSNEFEQIAKNRLERTQKMMSEFGYN